MIIPLFSSISLKQVHVSSDSSRETVLSRSVSLKAVRIQEGKLTTQLFDSSSVRIAGYKDSSGNVQPMNDMSYTIIRH